MCRLMYEWYENDKWITDVRFANSKIGVIKKLMRLNHTTCRINGNQEGKTMEDTIHAGHTCFACGHVIAWAGNLFGGLTVSHGSEVDATICVSQSANPYGQVELSVQLQCSKCKAVNQFKVLHQVAAQV